MGMHNAQRETLQTGIKNEKMEKEMKEEEHGGSSRKSPAQGIRICTACQRSLTGQGPSTYTTYTVNRASEDPAGCPSAWGSPVA